MHRLILLALLFSPLLQAAPLVDVSDAFWQPVPARELASRGVQAPQGTAWRLQETALRQQLALADNTGQATITLPVDGRPQRFSATPSPVMAPELAARYPEIRTYRIRGIDDPAASGRLSMTPRGLGAVFDASGETRYIDPDRQAGDLYRVQRRSLASHSGRPFVCGVSGAGKSLSALKNVSNTDRIAQRSTGNVRVYRLAMATTVEYTNQVSLATSVTTADIKRDVLAEMARLLTRLNQVYERDLAVRLELVANNDLLISVGDPAQDPFTNTDGSLMLDENQAFIDQTIGASSYDIGHVLSTGGGGIANVNSVCVTGAKAKGVTGLSNPVGDVFYIDFVAHEIGHQFGADHSFNGTSGGCSGNRWSSQAWEPGSGSTIMSYAGICDPENTSLHAIDMFHGGSIRVIDGSNGALCGSSVSANDPNPPVITPAVDRVIPKLTPFRLDAVATDADGDPLTYAWDEMDAGTATTSSSFGKDLGNNALFRSYAPSSDAGRDFPSLGLTLKGQYDKAEVLPCQSRQLNLRVTVRDGRGGLAQDDVRLTVDGNSGPFRVTSHQSAQIINPVDPVILTWDPAGTQNAPVACNAVDISLLSFNTATNEYGETLLSGGQPNDGSASIRLPNRLAERARFRVKCSNNVFYALSAADLRIEGDPNNPFPVTGAVAFSNPDAAWTVGTQPVDGTCVVATTSNTGSSTVVSSGGSGSGALTPWLLCWLAGLWGWRRRCFRVCSGS